MISRHQSQSEGIKVANNQIQQPQMNQYFQGQFNEQLLQQVQAQQFPGQQFYEQQQGRLSFSADQQQQPLQAQNQIGLHQNQYIEFPNFTSNLQGSPDQSQWSINQFQGSPNQFQGSNGQFQGPPSQQFQGPSVQLQGKSGSIQEASGQIQGPPGQFQDPPIQFQGQPVQFQEPPGQFQWSSSQFQEQSVQFQGPPGQFQDPTVQIQRQIGSIQGIPGQFQDPAVQIQRQIGSIQGIPGQFQDPAVQIQRQIGSIQGIPGQFQDPAVQIQRQIGSIQGPPGQFQDPTVQIQRQIGSIQGFPGQIKGPPGETQGNTGLVQLPIQDTNGQIYSLAQKQQFQISALPGQQQAYLVSPFDNLQLNARSINKNQKVDNKEIISLKQEIEIINQELETSKRKSDEKDNQIKKLQQEKKKYENQHQENLDEQQKEYDQKIKQIQQNWDYDKNKFKNQIDNQKKEIDELKEQVEELIQENEKLRRRTNQNNIMISNLPQMINDDQNQVNQLRKKNQELSKQIKDRDVKILNMEQEIENLNRQFEIRNEEENQNQTKKNQDLNNLIKEQGQKLRLLETQINELSHQAFVEQKKREDRDLEIRKLKQKMEELQNSIHLKEIEINNDKKIIQFLQEQSNKFMSGNERQQEYPSLNQEFQRLQENMQKEIAYKKQKDEKKKEDEQRRLIEQNAQRNQIIKERDQLNKLEKQKKAMKLREAIMNTQGILQVGLLVDVTGSMDKYKDATMNIIQRTMACIKNQTNRDCEWGSVCYQDFAELKQRGQYLEHQFTRDSNIIINFFKNIVCDGGDDGAEDLRNGIKQLINNLKWEKFFKIALLICDAPSHGKKWAGNVLDDYPNEDLEDALQQLINKNIVLIGIEFTQSTDVMFAQMINFYAKQNKQQLLIIVDLKNKNPDQIQDQLINIISEASISITEVNQSGTKSKKQNIVRDGAFEALVKLLPDPTKFDLDPKISTIQTKFNVYRVEINQSAFENNITSIYRIRIPDDYQITLESEWNCTRTLKPFAFGQLKEVYLMKKLDNSVQNEVYVIKMPIGGQTYKTMNEALLECRSHLISKRLMQKFIQSLNDKGFNAPQIKYSDFLILKEHDTSYWIAERFFQGEFTKFNNNFGYINPKKDLINILAQVFTYYTFHISDFSYMICDVQGVGYNFTDPAINTTEDNFDETDQGQDGIGQFIISFEKDKKNLYQKYIDILDLKD